MIPADLTSIDFNAYVHNLVDNIVQSYLGSSGLVKIEVDMDEISLSLDAAIPCGLIVSELVTNSLKHAFPGEREGMIHVTMTNPEKELMIIKIHDDGIGIPENTKTDGSDSLGLMLVDLLSKNQLSGTLERVDEGGTSYTITFEDKKAESGV